MHQIHAERPVSVAGPDGAVITRRDLPSPQTERWVARRKATVVAAVDGGLISAEEACQTYKLSEEELDGWRAAMAKHGVNALRTTALKRYREV